MDGFEFDLAMVMLSYSTIPEDFDITDDRHLRNLDMQSVTSLNGARVTDTIQRLVPQMQVIRNAKKETCLGTAALEYFRFTSTNGSEQFSMQKIKMGCSQYKISYFDSRSKFHTCELFRSL